MPTAGIDHIELAIEYLQQASPDKSAFYQKLIGALVKLDEYAAAIVIELLQSDDQLEDKIIEEFASSLVSQQYYPIHLGLRLIENREYFSKSVETEIVKLLDHQDFFIARRVSDFLSNQQLSESAKEELESFKVKYADRL